MILAADVHYLGNIAHAAGILFPRWDSDEIGRVILKRVTDVPEYESGAFYKRELPCLLELLSDVDVVLKFIIIDGFVDLGGEKKPGLGRHLFESLSERVPVIGVAKTPYLETPKECEVFRGGSRKPLYVTAAGLSLEGAKSLVSALHGENRIPTLLAQVDRLTREMNGENPTGFFL